MEFAQYRCRQQQRIHRLAGRLPRLLWFILLHWRHRFLVVFYYRELNLQCLVPQPEYQQRQRLPERRLQDGREIGPLREGLAVKYVDCTATLSEDLFRRRRINGAKGKDRTPALRAGVY